MPITLSPQSTVAEAALSNPAAIRLFESLGIDYCSGGRRTIRDAAVRAGVSAEQVLESLEAAASKSAAFQTDWTVQSIAHLIEHIEAAHHSYIRSETPRIETLLAKVSGRHGASHPELLEVQQVFVAMAQELATHLLKEERILFPYAIQLERGAAAGACFDSIEQPIGRMFEEHDDAGELLATLRRLTNGFHAPDGACMSYRALYDALEAFERDLHLHIHLENNVLFPKAIEAERRAKP